ncbi:hypothetical protein AB0K11_24755 [Mycobacterium sp. NPDC050551]|uniref:hypothetical protein n=1 Tax=Mycobacterium sp. NPDC050551 TaxID=3155407 RepID=UPI00342B4B77
MTTPPPMMTMMTPMTLMTTAMMTMMTTAMTTTAMSRGPALSARRRSSVPRTGPSSRV